MQSNMKNTVNTSFIHFFYITIKEMNEFNPQSKFKFN